MYEIHFSGEFLIFFRVCDHYSFTIESIPQDIFDSIFIKTEATLKKKLVRYVENFFCFF